MTITVSVKAADGATTQIALADPVVQTATGSAHYVATLTLGTTVYTFDSANAVDQGNYVGQFVQQKSLMVAPAGCPFAVFFRPDVNGLRDEVVVELGKMWSGTPAHVTTPYTFSVTKNGTPLFTQTVPYHWWWARWRWQSAPRLFVRLATSLISDGHFLPHTADYLYGYKPWATNYAYSPMGLAGITAAMGATGDRPELGALTLPQSDYILLGTPLAKSSMIAQAEASASLPFHFRDETTGAWLDNRAHPYYSIDDRELPLIPHPAASSNANFAILDSAHMPSLCYAPYLFTDDPYYLEELQAMALYHIVEVRFFAVNAALPGLVNPGQTRGTAWGVRTVAQSAKATPATVPSWLLPKSLQLANLADNRTLLQRYQDSPALVHKVFRAYSRVDPIVAFHDDYKMIVLAWVVRMGFTEWADGYAWAIGCIMPLTTGDKTGWWKGWPNPYYFRALNVTSTVWDIIFTDTSHDGITYPTWNAAFQRFIADGITVTGSPDATRSSGYPPTWDGTTIVQQQTYVSYFYWRQASFHLAEGLGLTGAAAVNTWLDPQIPTVKARLDSATNDPRWSFAKVA